MSRRICDLRSYCLYLVGIISWRQTLFCSTQSRIYNAHNSVHIKGKTLGIMHDTSEYFIFRFFLAYIVARDLEVRLLLPDHLLSLQPTSTIKRPSTPFPKKKKKKRIFGFHRVKGLVFFFLRQ